MTVLNSFIMNLCITVSDYCENILDLLIDLNKSGIEHSSRDKLSHMYGSVSHNILRGVFNVEKSAKDFYILHAEMEKNGFLPAWGDLVLARVDRVMSMKKTDRDNPYIYTTIN